MPDPFDYDLFVIGGGSGGVRAARVAAQAGARVGVAEEYRFGGTCVIRGCVPKKLMVIASAFSQAFADAKGFGWDVGPVRFDWGRLVSQRDAELARLEAIYRRLLREVGVTMHDRRAELVDPHRVRLAGGETIAAKHILIATGGHPVVPEVEGGEHAITSNEFFQLEAQPKRVLIIGGGYIACEFATILNGLGSRVTMFYRGEQILRGFDDDIRDHLADALRARGVAIEVHRDLDRIEKTGDGLKVTATNGETHVVDAVLFATGRAPNTAGLGLEAAGVQLRRNGAVVVDEWSQTNIPSIFAVGDVTDRAQLTPVAIREGQAFADTVFGGRPVRADHGLIPTAIFTQPEVGTVGIGEAEARAAMRVEIYRSRFRPMHHILAGREETVLIKLIVAAESRKVLGCHIVGQGAGEMVQLAAIALKMGATKEDFDRTVAVHPTVAEELVTLRDPVG